MHLFERDKVKFGVHLITVVVCLNITEYGWNCKELDHLENFRVMFRKIIYLGVLTPKKTKKTSQFTNFGVATGFLWGFFGFSWHFLLFCFFGFFLR